MQHTLGQSAGEGGCGLKFNEGQDEDKGDPNGRLLKEVRAVGIEMDVFGCGLIKDDSEKRDEKGGWSERIAGQSRIPCASISGRSRVQDAVWSSEAGQSESRGRALEKSEDLEINEAAEGEMERTTDKMIQDVKKGIPDTDFVMNEFDEAETGTEMEDVFDSRQK